MHHERSDHVVLGCAAGIVRNATGGFDVGELTFAPYFVGQDGALVRPSFEVNVSIKKCVE
jgi:hypothetical protein